MLQLQHLLELGITKEQILQSAYNTPRKAFIRIRLYNTSPKLATIPSLFQINSSKVSRLTRTCFKDRKNVTNSIIDYKINTSERTGNRRIDMITDLLYLEDLKLALDNPDYTISFETQNQETTYTIRTKSTTTVGA